MEQCKDLHTELRHFLLMFVGCFSLFLSKKKVLACEGRLQRKGLSLKQRGI